MHKMPGKRKRANIANGSDTHSVNGSLVKTETAENGTNWVSDSSADENEEVSSNPLGLSELVEKSKEEIARLRVENLNLKLQIYELQRYESECKELQTEVATLRKLNYYLQKQLPKYVEELGSMVMRNPSNDPLSFQSEATPSFVEEVQQMEDETGGVSSGCVSNSLEIVASYHELKVLQFLDAETLQRYFSCARHFKHLTGLLMDRLFTQDQLQSCSVRGVRSTKEPLPSERVEAIIEAVRCMFPDTKESDIVYKMTIKLRDAASAAAAKTG